MEPIFLIFFLSSLLSSFSAEAICVPRNSSRASPSPSPFSAPPHISPSPLPSRLPSPLSAQTVDLPPTALPSSSPASPPEPEISSPPTVSLSSLLSSLADPALKKICDATDNPALCISSIAPYLKGEIDPISILEMAIKACTNRTELALAEATRIAKDPSTTPITSSYLETCQENYSDAIDNLQAAADAIAIRDVGTMNSMLSAALTDFSTCEDGFSEVQGLFSPMTKIDDTLSKLASNCLAIVSLIH